MNDRLRRRSDTSTTRTPADSRVGGLAHWAMLIWLATQYTIGQCTYIKNPKTRTLQSFSRPYYSYYSPRYASLLCGVSKSNNNNNSKGGDDRSLLSGDDPENLQDDIARRLSLSKNRAMSALSRPKNSLQTTKKTAAAASATGSSSSSKKSINRSYQQRGPKSQSNGNRSATDQNDRSSSRSLLPPAVGSTRGTNGEKNDSRRWTPKRSKQMETPRSVTKGRNPSGKVRGETSARPAAPIPVQVASPRKPRVVPGPTSYSSLLPPPLTDTLEDDDDPLSSGLSSWEEFLGVNRDVNKSINHQDRKASWARNAAAAAGMIDPAQSSGRSWVDGITSENMTDVDPVDAGERLPSIQDLFPPDLSYSSLSIDPSSLTNSSMARERPTRVLDGVLPVSDLFYRSSPSSSRPDHDDEELPFSAEQSDALSSDNNKVLIRRNLANQKWRMQDQTNNHPDVTTTWTTSSTSRNISPGKVDTTTTASAPSRGPPRSSRRLVRRGMDLLVGGIPIHADPPQRSLELFYDDSVANTDWARVISLNSRDFGPLLYTTSISKVSNFERGLYCEYFCNAALKWDVCPHDLRQIIRDSLNIPSRRSRFGTAAPRTKTPIGHNETVLRGRLVASTMDSDDNVQSLVIGEQRAQSVALSDTLEDIEDDAQTLRRVGRSPAPPGQGSSHTTKPDPVRPADVFASDGECFFEIGLSREEIETAPDVFQDVVMRSFRRVMDKAADRAKRSTTRSPSTTEAIQVNIPGIHLKEAEDGSTGIQLAFRVVLWSQAGRTSADRRLSEIKEALDSAIEEGQFEFALAATAKEETRWPPGLGERVIEECMIDDDVREELVYAHSSWEKPNEEKSLITSKDSSTLRNSGEQISNSENVFAGGGNEGVFRDFSEANALASPYGGQIGLRLVDAVIERAKQRLPRVIAIGDVHGCIDELQDLLRECDYRPGDLVVFLGDLVCKGPDSISVVQMAREIGAIGVRGNHDFEVIRWHQAIKSGVDPPVVGSEHFHIASCLSKADIKWMHSLPWYISSKDLACLFVHAGFVSGIRLSKQNPRLMMNMRSILPDGTVTSKFFNQWPWARLWDGPQTVLFGHDADRGLQQYEHGIGLDTGCVYGGRLTACILPEKRLVSVSARREYFKYRRRHYD